MPDPGSNEYDITRLPAAPKPGSKPRGGKGAGKKRRDAPSPSDDRPDSNWLSRCLKNDKGEPLGNLANAMLAMRADPVLRDTVAYDEMLRSAVIVQGMPGQQKQVDQQKPEPVTDTDVGRMQEYLQLSGLPRLSKDTAHQAVDLRARECSFHPLKEILEGLEWDRKPRVRSWLATYLGAESTPYTQGIGTMFLVAMVARIFEPGCKADYMLVLEGEQGAMKSTACRVLGDKWYSDNLPDIMSGKDVQQHLRGKWLIEISELSALNRAENNALKSFISRQVEEYRPAFGRRDVHEPRQCVFIGTTNKKNYLKDETGDRRYWPVQTGAVKIDDLSADRDQLFAEAVALYRAGERSYPDRAFELEHIKPQQEARFEADAWEQAIIQWLDDSTYRTDITLSEVAQGALDMQAQKIGTSEQRRIGNILERMGWRSTGKVVRGRRPWVRL